jgi:hypothetical protein
MPNQYSPNTAKVMVYLPCDIRDRLFTAVAYLNQKNTNGTPFSASGLMGREIEKTVKTIETEMYELFSVQDLNELLQHPSYQDLVKEAKARTARVGRRKKEG